MVSFISYIFQKDTGLLLIHVALIVTTLLLLTVKATTCGGWNDYFDTEMTTVVTTSDG